MPTRRSTAVVVAGGVELSSYPDRCVLALERRTLPAVVASAPGVDGGGHLEEADEEEGQPDCGSSHHVRPGWRQQTAVGDEQEHDGQ